jgi:hypothetical protein
MKKDAWRHKWTSKEFVRHLLVLRMEQLNVGTNDLPSVVKKKVAAACPLAGGAHGGGGQYPWPEGGGSARTLAWMADWRQWRPVSTWRRWQPVSDWRRRWWPHRRLSGYGRPSPWHHGCWGHMRTLQHESLTCEWVRIWILNWKRKRVIHVIHRSVGLRVRRVHWDVDHMGRGLRAAQITLIICYQIELDKLNIYETLTWSIPKMCWWLCMRFYIISSRCLSLSSAAASAVQDERVDEEVEVLVCRQA